MISGDEAREMMEEKEEKIQALAELASDENLKFGLDERIYTIADTRNDVWAPISPSDAREVADLLEAYADQVEAVGSHPTNNRYPEDYPEEPKIIECPVDGCDRTVIGDSTAIRNHVRNLEDDAHRDRILTEDFEVRLRPSIQPASECSW